MPNALNVDQDRRPASRIFSGIPEPSIEPVNLASSVSAIRSNLETLIRDRGLLEHSALLVGELDYLTEYYDQRYQNFVAAAYLSMDAAQDTAFPDLGAAWQDLNIITNQAFPSYQITHVGNGQFTFQRPGVYHFTVTAAFSHNEINAGREFGLRLYDYSSGVGGLGTVFGTGRNQGVTNITGSLSSEVGPQQVGAVYGIQIGNGDAYTSVIFLALGYDVFSVGRAPGAL